MLPEVQRFLANIQNDMKHMRQEGLDTRDQILQVCRENVQAQKVAMCEVLLDVLSEIGDSARSILNERVHGLVEVDGRNSDYSLPKPASEEREVHKYAAKAVPNTFNNMKDMWDLWHGEEKYLDKPCPGGYDSLEAKFGAKWRRDHWKPGYAQDKHFNRIKRIVRALKDRSAETGVGIEEGLAEFDAAFKGIEVKKSVSKFEAWLKSKNYILSGSRRRPAHQNSPS